MWGEIMYFESKSNMRSILLYIFLFISFTGYTQTAREFLQTSLKSYGAWENVKTFSYGLEGYRIAVAQGKTY
jgi:hypothetical protein